MGKALVVIDIQNDYFPGGRYPQWNPEATLAAVLAAIAGAQAQGLPVFLIQHVASAATAPFFTAGSPGVELHPQLRAAAATAPVLVKQHADSFQGTGLEASLHALGVTELLVCGMMTQNCVTHTALSKAAERYRVTILTDACTSVDPMIHGIALNALASRGLAQATVAVALGA